MKHRSYSQKARDGAIVKKLATEQELSEEEEERLAQLILIAAENLGIIRSRRRIMGERWVTLLLYDDEILRCDQCHKLINKQKVHLYLDVTDWLDEVLCDKCWKHEQKEVIQN